MDASTSSGILPHNSARPSNERPQVQHGGWQRLRKAVLARDGYVCQIQGPNCTLAATTCDHIYPVSTHPHLFWAEENLRAACRKCNFGSGSRISLDSDHEPASEKPKPTPNLNRVRELVAEDKCKQAQA